MGKKKAKGIYFNWDAKSVEVFDEACGKLSRSYWVWQALWEREDVLQAAKKKRIAKPVRPKEARGGDHKSKKFRQLKKEQGKASSNE